MSNVNERTAVAVLIDEARERNGWTDRGIAREAQKAGCSLTSSDVSLYRRGQVAMLNPAKLSALAVGLKVPAYKVAIAFLTDHGIVVPEDVRTPEDAIHHDHTLSAKTKDALLAIIASDRA